ncbi:MAG: hypothetical protein HQL46_06475 [Gammaproteobacteria bacterium]|nr:hypothetical protein [Gammaproteobacteria bacterium]
MMTEDKKYRLDKWLWAARFYKTRNLATEAIKGGKVHLNDARVKAGKTVEVGHSVRIKKEGIEQTVIVDALSDKRGSATIAQALYTETDESIEKREIFKSQRKAQYANIGPAKRPTKKQRRHIIKFKQDANELS